jgi:hypothetical protein
MTPRQPLQSHLLQPLEFDDVICRLRYETLTFIHVCAFDDLIQDPFRKYIVSRRWRAASSDRDIMALRF